MMKLIEFNIVTIFKEIFSSPFESSIIKKAQERGIVKILLHDLRDYTHDRHRTVDDYSYGGGSGMVMKLEPYVEAINGISKKSSMPRVILMTPQGEVFSHKKAMELSQEERLIILCGRYEGIDERIRFFVDDEISIGDYVLTGGDIPAMVIIDAVSRLVPGVVGEQESIERDSFVLPMLDYPHYTRPDDFNGLRVPDVLLSGDHREIEKWRRREALKRTLKRRPDILKDAELSEKDKLLLKELS